MKKLFLGLFTSFVREQQLIEETEQSNIERLNTEQLNTEQRNTAQMKIEQWQELYQLSQIHHAGPMIYDSLSKTSLIQEMPQGLKAVWRRDTMLTIARQMQLSEAFLHLYNGMKNAGLHPVVVKGIICRSLYPKPDYRMSSDEDVLIPKEEFWKMNQFLLERGFWKDDADEDLRENMENLHEVGYRNRNNGLYLEIHLTLFPEDSGAYGHWNQYFERERDRSGTGYYAVVKIGNHEVSTLNHTEHYLYLLCHSLKHFLHSGFGVRQLFDIILFAENYGNQIDWKYIIEVTKKERMYLFMQNLFDIGIRYLQFDIENAAYPEKIEGNLDSEELLDDLLVAGIYGASSEERLHSSNITLAAVNRKEQKGGLWASLFPGYKYMASKYEYVKKYKWMLPIGWGHRIFSHVFSGRRVESRAIIEVGNQRVGLLKKYGVIE